MIIEQTKEQIDDSISFHSRSEIGSIRLVRARIWNRERVTKMKGEDVTFDIGFKPGPCSLEDGVAFLQTDFRFTINDNPTEGASDAEPLIVVECCFEAEYRLSADFTPSEQQIEAFRSANAVFNCWPFFREFVQASVRRMDFPQPPVPFLRLSRKRESVARKAARKLIQAKEDQSPAE